VKLRNSINIYTFDIDINDSSMYSPYESRDIDGAPLNVAAREDCYAYIRKHGGEVSKSVTGRVTHILNDHGEVGPAKKRKAADRNIPIVGEDTLLALVDPSRAPSQ
jgi:hypothetical protein